MVSSAVQHTREVSDLSLTDEHTEELLIIHEEEIRRLKEDRRMKGPLLHSIRKYFDILEDEKELAAAAGDQSRLLGRGPRDPGRLLREEKMRKRVTKEKPRVSAIAPHSRQSNIDDGYSWNKTYLCQFRPGKRRRVAHSWCTA